MSYNFGEKKGPSAVEISRRERAERAEKRRLNDAQKRILRAFRRHVVLRGALREMREGWDAAVESAFPGKALQQLKVAPQDVPLPPAQDTFRLARQILFFFCRKVSSTSTRQGPDPESARAEDRKRLAFISRVISASTTRASPPSCNYCFLSCDSQRLDTWGVVTKSLLTLVVAELSDLVGGPDPPASDSGATAGPSSSRQTRGFSRVEYGVYVKLLLDVAEVRKWAFIRIQGTQRADYTPEQEAVIAGLLRAGGAVCAAFQRHLAMGTELFDVQRRFLQLHVNPVPPAAGDGAAQPRLQPPASEDVLATATLRLCGTLLKSPEALERYTAALLATPFLPLKLPPASVAALLAPDDRWGAVLRAVRTPAAKGKEFWAEHRHAIGNFVEIGSRYLLSPGGGGGAAASRLRAEQWLDGVVHVVAHLPSWTHVKRHLDAEPHLEAQITVLWSPQAVSALFSTLLAVPGSDGDPPVQEGSLNTPTRRGGGAPDSRAAGYSDAAVLNALPAKPTPQPEKHGFFARIRKLAKGGGGETPAPGPAPAAAAAPAGGVGGVLRRAAKGGDGALHDALERWRRPEWLKGCRLYILLINKWSNHTVLSALAARSFLVGALWGYIEQTMPLTKALVEGGLGAPGAAGRLPEEVHDATASVVLMFAYCYGHFLPVCDDYEFYSLQQPFAISVVKEIVVLLSKLAFRLAWQDCSKMDPARQELLSRLKMQCRSVLLLLSDRNVRKSFCDRECWTVESFKTSLGFHFDPTAGTFETEIDPKVKSVVHDMPFLICFADRAMYLRKLIEKDRAANNMSMVKYGITIRRDYLFEDGMDQIAKLVGSGTPGAGSGVMRLKARFHVQFKNAQGLEEAGIDAGGVFKEFIEALAVKGFNPDLGLFRTTEDNKIYPNAESQRLYAGVEARGLYEFLGRIVAKAIYEGVVLNVPFAEFFLNTMLGRANFVEDLKALDPEFHKNLMQLKEMDNVEDLCLAFSYEEERMGKTVEVNLIPHGSDVPVTNDNLIQYISTLAHVKLNLQFRDQAAAFMSGFHDVLPPRWVGLFNRNELQQLISGLSSSFDIMDLRDHTKYLGNYHAQHAVMKNLWKTLEEFDDAQKGAFLAFVTSSSKPPLLGFAHLHPPFCIRSADDCQQQLFGSIDRLPSASTCFNLLKLPPYKSKKELKSKLLYAITSGAGFELS